MRNERGGEGGGLGAVGSGRVRGGEGESVVSLLSPTLPLTEVSVVESTPPVCRRTWFSKSVLFSFRRGTVSARGTNICAERRHDYNLISK